LIAFQHQLFTRHYRYRRVALRDDVIVEQARRDHEALLAAVTQRQPAAAAKIIRRHILRTQEAAEALVRAFEAGSRSRKSRVRPAAGAKLGRTNAKDRRRLGR
jgi:DNA-binding GntR family transcriptional regulator